MNANELLKKIRKIEIKTRGLSQNIFAGEYHSAFKGRGVIFSEVREYLPGDDIRDIDWNVTARQNKPFVKVYEEERELTVMLLIDVSGSRDFGACGDSKKEKMAEIAATLAFSSITNNDKVGVIFFSDKIEKFIPPKKGRKHILLIIREIINFQPESSGTDIDVALKFLTNAIKKRCVWLSGTAPESPVPSKYEWFPEWPAWSCRITLFARQQSCRTPHTARRCCCRRLAKL